VLYWLGLPSDFQKWGVWFSCSLGTLLGYVVHPRIWLTLTGPFRWWSFMSATMAQESNYTADASGDDGQSLGVLQFGTMHLSGFIGADSLTSGSADPRLSPFKSGYYAAKYVSDTLSNSFSWYWKTAVPVLGFSAIRMMWTGGSSAEIASRPFFSQERVSSGAAVGMTTRAIEEGERQNGPTLGYTSFFTWRLITLPLAIWSGRCLLRKRSR
jgi:hypothetical protein